MANFGLSKPWMAKYNPETDKYSNAFKCGKAMTTAVTPNYNEASMYADNQQSEQVTEFKNASVTVGTDRIPKEAAELMFGHEISVEGGEINKSGDEAGYVGYGFIVSELRDGVKKYRACLLHKVQFKEGEESYETKGDSIALKGSNLSGTAIPTSKGVWRTKSPLFGTEEEADIWLQEKIGAKEKCETPIASVRAGSYEAAQSVTLTTATAGAKIRYTTDGTTPSSTNGTEYKSAINIATNTGLRAVAYKDADTVSDVMLVEYFITA